MSDSRASEPHVELNEPSTVRVTTGSRLHFGLLDTIAPFGGVGVMVDAPQTCVVVRPSHGFQCSSKFESRIKPIAERISRWLGWDKLPACRVEVEQAAPSHFGLGSGTQISLAVSEGVCHFLRQECDRATLVRELATRGRRSAVGAHGYFLGGLIYELGDSDADLNPTRKCVKLPKEWTAIVMRPTEEQHMVSGENERDKFATLSAADSASARLLRQIVSEGIVAGAETQDFPLFADSVRRYNERSGQLFSQVQGGPYNGPGVTGVIDWLASEGVVGFGQSSWGPGVFAWCESKSEAMALKGRLPPSIELLTATTVRNEPRTLDAS
ncbi:MAG: beta-ribofuranosylaminobenzene 5'-phosphate synthase [Rubripirellula sp.]